MKITTRPHSAFYTKDKTEEAFVCPFCGAPYRKLIPAGAVQVRCRYCGATVIVPPQLGGVVQRCPNHPDFLAQGLCNDCSRSYCGHCLYILRVEYGKLHLCPKCYERRGGRRLVVSFFALAFFIIVLALTLLTTPTLVELFTAFIFLLCLMVIVRNVKKKPPTVHDSRQS